MNRSLKKKKTFLCPLSTTTTMPFKTKQLSAIDYVQRGAISLAESLFFSLSVFGKWTLSIPVPEWQIENADPKALVSRNSLFFCFVCIKRVPTLLIPTLFITGSVSRPKIVEMYWKQQQQQKLNRTRRMTCFIFKDVNATHLLYYVDRVSCTNRLFNKVLLCFLGFFSGNSPYIDIAFINASFRNGLLHILQQYWCVFRFELFSNIFQNSKTIEKNESFLQLSIFWLSQLKTKTTKAQGGWGYT